MVVDEIIILKASYFTQLSSQVQVFNLFAFINATSSHSLNGLFNFLWENTLRNVLKISIHITASFCLLSSLSLLFFSNS